MAKQRTRKRAKARKDNDQIDFADRLTTRGDVVAERTDELGHRPVPAPAGSLPYDRARIDALLAEKGTERNG